MRIMFDLLIRYDMLTYQEHKGLLSSNFAITAKPNMLDRLTEKLKAIGVKFLIDTMSVLPYK